MNHKNKVRSVPDSEDTDPQDPFNTAINQTRDINNHGSKFSNEKTHFRDVTPISTSTLEKLATNNNQGDSLDQLFIGVQQPGSGVQRTPKPPQGKLPKISSTVLKKLQSKQSGESQNNNMEQTALGGAIPEVFPDDKNNVFSSHKLSVVGQTQEQSKVIENEGEDQSEDDNDSSSLQDKDEMAQNSVPFVNRRFSSSFSRKSTIFQDKLDKELQANKKEAGEEINEVNKLLKKDFEKRSFTESSVKQKNFEDSYLTYLKELSNHDQEQVYDKPAQLQKPKVLEKKYREKYVNDLKNNNKIDNYEIKLKPKISLVTDPLKDDIIFIPENSLSKSTLQYLEEKDDDEVNQSGSQLTFDMEERHIFSINQVDIEHYSFDENNQYMIVKVVEQVQHKNARCLYHTIRIFQEVLMDMPPTSPSDKKVSNRSGSAFARFTRRKSSIRGSKENNKILSPKAKNKKGYQDNQGNQKKYRYKEIKSILVSDSGIQIADVPAKQQNVQTTSILYFGPFMYFWVMQRGDDGVMKQMLHKIDLSTFDQPDDIEVEAMDQYVIDVSKKDKTEQQGQVSVHFAKECDARGQKLKYSEKELLMVDKFETKFLQSQFVQVVDGALEKIDIYCLCDLDQLLSNQVEMKNCEFHVKNEKYLGTFVLRGLEDDEHNNQLDRIANFKKDVNSLNKTDYFISLYDCCYYVLSYIKAGVKDSFFSPDLQSFNYLKNQSEKKQNMEEMYNIFSGPLANQKAKTKISTQVHNIQAVYVRKYDIKNVIDPDQQKEIRKSLNLTIINEMGSEQGSTNDNLETEGDLLDVDKEQSFSLYEKVLFFIDDSKNIQLVHLTDSIFTKDIAMFNTVLQKREEWSRRCKYYQDQIKEKIGYPKGCAEDNDEMVLVNYVKDQQIYSDLKFPAEGLIEHFTHLSTNFVNRKIQNKNQNYLIGSNGSSQYCYVFKQQNKDEATFNRFRPDYTFDIIKMINIQYQENESLQYKQIKNFLKHTSHEDISQVPQIRINKVYKDTISTWQSLRLPNQQNLSMSKYLYDPVKCNMFVNAHTESTFQFLIVELDDGQYARLKVYDRNIIKTLEEKHKLANQDLKLKFHFSPITYIKSDEIFIFVFQMRVYLKTSQEYMINTGTFFTNLTKEQVQNLDGLDDAILGKQSKVRFLKVQKIDQFVLTKEKQLCNFNVYLTEFFKCNETKPGFHRNSQLYQITEDKKVVYQLNKKAMQTQLIFEQIVDSKSPQDFVPFVSFQQNIGSPLSSAEKIGTEAGTICNITIQNLIITKGQIKITQGCMIGPKLHNRQTLIQENSINLWRSSDVYEKKNKNLVIHYNISYNFFQEIERVQVQDIQITLNKKKLVQQTKIVSVSEWLQSYLKTLNHREMMLAHEARLENIYQDYEQELKESDDNPNMTEESLASQALNIPYFDEEGYLKPYESTEYDNLQSFDLKPIANNYRSAFLEFGYKKQNSNENRGFNLLFESRLTIDCIIHDIFTIDEQYYVHHEIIKQMLKMKPVLYQDFEFLLLSNHKTYQIDQLVEDNFFQPQEIFKGQTIADIYINDPEEINQKIVDYVRLQDTNKHDANQTEGSLFDMLLQNCPQKAHIQSQSHLEVQNYLIVSLDFNFKSQIMRCKEVNAKHSMQIFLENIHKINSIDYSQILEHDLYRLMTLKKIDDILPFFQSTPIQDNGGQPGCDFEVQLKGDNLPSSWHELQTQLFMYKFQDHQNHQEEIVQRLAKISGKHDDEKKPYEVVHKCINFQIIQIGEKIKRLNENTKNLQDFYYQFDELAVADFMLQNEHNKGLYEMETAQKIVDAQFVKSLSFFQKIMAIYLVGFIIPMVINMWYYVSYGYNGAVVLTCFIIAAITLFVFFLIELAFIRVQGRSYFSISHMIDIGQFTIFILLAVFTKNNYDQGKLQEPDEEDYHIIILKTVLLGIILHKFLYFMSLFARYGFLIKMVTLTVYDMVPFTLFFVIFLMFFTVLAMIQRQEPEEEYQQLKLFQGLFLDTFRNTMGDFNVPKYCHWMRQSPQCPNGKDEVNMTMIYLIWLMWLLNAVFLLILLLNFLIAVISQTYERVSSQRIIYTYTYKAEKNFDYYQIIDLFKKRRGIKYLVFVSSSDILLDQGENEWLGQINSIKKHINKKDKRLQENFQKLKFKVENQAKAMDEKIDAVHRDLSSEMRELNFMMRYVLNQGLPPQKHGSNISVKSNNSRY